MFADFRKLTENYFDKYYAEEQDYFDQDFTSDYDKFDFDFEDGVVKAIQPLIDTELNEKFSSEQNAEFHFKKHCNRRSVRQAVSYDFKTLEDYINYEKYISNKCKRVLKDDKMYIKDLADYDKVISAFRKLFEGNQCLVFGLTCGFENNIGAVRLCINSFASDKTLNYTENNTVNFLIQAPDQTTLTLYAVDADYIKNKINSQIDKLNKRTGKNYELL